MDWLSSTRNLQLEHVSQLELYGPKVRGKTSESKRQRAIGFVALAGHDLDALNAPHAHIYVQHTHTHTHIRSTRCHSRTFSATRGLCRCDWVMNKTPRSSHDRTKMPLKGGCAGGGWVGDSGDAMKWEREKLKRFQIDKGKLEMNHIICSLIVIKGYVHKYVAYYSSSVKLLTLIESSPAALSIQLLCFIFEINIHSWFYYGFIFRCVFAKRGINTRGAIRENHTRIHTQRHSRDRERVNEGERT